MFGTANFVDCLLLGQSPSQGSGFASLLSSPLPMLVVVGVLMYLMILRPDSKKRKEAEAMLSNLKKNDPVVTIGGICGTVVNVSSGSAVVTIRVDDGTNTRLRVLRSAIARVGNPEDGESSESK